MRALEIIHMFNTALNKQLPIDKLKAELGLYPEWLRKQIDEGDDWVYDTVNSKFGDLPPLLFLSGSILCPCRWRISIRLCD